MILDYALVTHAMDLIKKYKNILIAVVVFMLLAGGYYYWKRSNPSIDTGSFLTSMGSTPESAFIGQDILSTLEELRHLHIDGSIFDNPAFKSLVDYTIATTSEPLGRSDPFAPLPTSGAQEQPSKK